MRIVRRWLGLSFLIGLFVLAHDFWNWDDPVTIGPLGIPRWIYGFALLQLGLATVIAWLWKPDADDHEHQ